MGQSAGEAGAASKSGTVGEGANRLATNQASLNQAAMGKSYRQSGLAQKSFDAMNAGMDADVRGAEIGGHQRGMDGIASARKHVADNHNSAGSHLKANIAPWIRTGLAIAKGSESGLDLGGDGSSANGEDLGSMASGIGQAATNANVTTSTLPGPTSGSTGASSAKKSGGGKSAAAGPAILTGIDAVADLGISNANYNATQSWLARSAHAGAAGLDFGWHKSRTDLSKGGLQGYGQRLGQEADFEANMAAWDAKNAFATHISGAAGVAGFNPGSIAPGPKPTDMAGLASSGGLGADTKRSAYYSGFGYMSSMDSMINRNRNRGSSLYLNNWTPLASTNLMGHANSIGRTLAENTTGNPVTGGVSENIQADQLLNALLPNHQQQLNQVRQMINENNNINQSSNPNNGRNP
jgi:hypothetical protein